MGRRILSDLKENNEKKQEEIEQSHFILLSKKLLNNDRETEPQRCAKSLMTCITAMSAFHWIIFLKIMQKIAV